MSANNVIGSFRQCQLLYSTQSGRAKACSRRCARILRENANLIPINGAGQTFDAGILELSDFVEKLRNSKTLLVLFVSTTGDGEHTDSIQRIWKLLLQRSLPPTLFKGIHFAIFNLGDRAYGPQFCAAGRKLAVRLLQLGGQLVGDAGYGDDGTPNGGVFADLDLWIRDNLLEPQGGGQTLPSQEPTAVSVPQSPIRVRVVSAANAGSSNETRQRCEDAYNGFFAKLSPLTAYSYDEHFHRSESLGSAKPPLVGHVVQNKRITADSWGQNTRYIRLDVAGEGKYKQSSEWSLDALPYRAGDVASTLPVQAPEFVERFLSMLPKSVSELADVELQVDVDKAAVQLLGVDCCLFWPRRCTLRGWLSLCADIHALPEREDLRALSRFCSLNDPQGKDQRDKLIALSETEGAALYADYILREKRTWPDVLYDFASLRASGSTLTLEALFSLLSPIRPRDFSIASSPSQEWLKFHYGLHVTSGFAVELCVAVVEGTTPLGRSYSGHCSSYLSSLNAANDDTSVRLWIRPGSFHGLPLGVEKDDSDNCGLEQPLICIGAGTGVAPLRGLILEREAVRQLSFGGVSQSGSKLEDLQEVNCDNILILGFRRRHSDFYYEKDWEELCETGHFRLLTAFSQDQAPKIYVQHILEKAPGANTWLCSHLLARAGAVYVAGSPKMAHAVKEVFVAALSTNPSVQEHVPQLFAKLQRQGRWAIEAWS